MRILFLSDNFPPEVNAPAGRTFEHCRLWARSGHDVTVITCFPNFPKGKVFPGYRRRLWQWETLDGVRVLRVWTLVSANEGFLKRILDYASFMAAASFAALWTGPADVVIGTSPQFLAAVAAWKVSVLKRAPFVFELRDLWPESIKTVGAMKDGAAIRLLERLERFLYRRAAAIVCVTKSFKDILINRGINPGKIHVVTNGVELGRFHPMPKDRELARKLGLEGKFTAGYIGTHGMAHGLETLLEAARMLKNEGDAKFRLLFLGDGARKEALKARAAELGLGNVLFVDTVAKEDVPRYWSLLDVSVIHLRKAELFKTVIPSKIFESMAMGIPILLGVAGESADIARESGAGLVFEPDNAQELARGLKRLESDPALFSALKAAGPKAALAYDRVRLAQEMLGVLVKYGKMNGPKTPKNETASQKHR